ncbi:MAG: MFS transporter [Pseudomonadota bacterium]
MKLNTSAGTLEQPGVLAGVFICLIFFVTQVNFSALSPVLPAIGERFALSGESTRLIVSYGFTGYMVGQLVWGPVSDYLGRSPVVITNLALYVLMAFLATLTSTGIVLMLVYIAMGFLAATFTSVGNAILKDRYEGDDYVKMMANVGIVMAAGPALAPGLAGLLMSLSHAGWEMAFYLLVAIGLIVCLGFTSFARYPSTRSDTPLQKESVGLLLRNGRYFVALFSFGLPFGILISYLASGPYLLLKHYDVDEHQFAWCYGLTTVVYLLGAVIFRRQSGSLRPVLAVYWGALLAFLGAFALLIVTLMMPKQLVPGMVSLALMLGGIGMIIPAGKAAAMAQVTAAFGLGASVMKFTQSACAVGVSALAALLFSHDAVMPFVLLYAGVCMLALLGAACLKKWSETTVPAAT